MSIAKGTAYGGFGEISCMAVGNNEISGMAIGDNVVWEMGAEIFDILSYPAEVTAGETFTIEISCNRRTNYILTYSVNGTTESGIVRSIEELYDTEDGKRVIVISLFIGSSGSRTMRIYGSTQQSSAADYRSVTYKDISITVKAG